MIFFGKDREFANEFIDRLENSLGTNKISKKITGLEDKLYKVQQKKKKLLDLLLEGRIEQKMFDSSLLKYGKEEVKLKAELEDFEFQLENEKQTQERVDSMRKALKSDMKINEFNRVLFESLIEKKS